MKIIILGAGQVGRTAAYHLAREEANDVTVPGKSACTGVCLNMWTPLLAESGVKAAGDYSLITRDDGKRQWAYKGKPLYRWYNDKKPGDQDGDGLRRVWHVAKP